ncbi:MAG: DUF3047 domain-containing protein [Nitrospirae bacterium]|nr:MAG: DUF3047 domain-containing protein [Nitrospirota bacterium]
MNHLHAYVKTRAIRLLFVPTFVVFSLIAENGGEAGNVWAVREAGTSDTLVLESFRHPDEEGFPQGWQGQTSTITAKKMYTIVEEDGAVFLRAQGANQRVYTRRIKWNPHTHPILKWRWRARTIPRNATVVAAVFANLDTDLLLIPVSTKYVWHATEAEGTVIEGGLFRPAQVVVQSGRASLGEWVEEEVNAYEDFLRIHQRKPALQAWGISLLAGPGVEIDFGPIEVQAATTR